MLHQPTLSLTLQRSDSNRLVGIVNVIVFLVDSHTSAWELVVHEKSDKPETTSIRICFGFVLNELRHILLADSVNEHVEFE